jgi:Zn-dependent protease
LTRIDIIRGFSTGKDKKEDDKAPVKSRMGMLATAGLGASFLFGKMKFVLIALKLTKAAPLASMVITSFAYSLFFGWPYAVGMVSLIFFHECGHAIVMKYYNVPFSPMVFIPFMGAVIAMKERPKNSYEEAVIAFGGPVVGSLAALGVSTGGVLTDSQLLYALADWGFMINLFNLMPIGSLDGGRIGSAIHPAMNSIGLVGGYVYVYGCMYGHICVCIRICMYIHIYICTHTHIYIYIYIYIYILMGGELVQPYILR